jgi:disulfide bond formation protein DsbB
MAQSLKLARIVALAVPLALLGGAYAFQYLGGLFPCEMCWWQRYALFFAGAMGIAAWAGRSTRVPLLLAGLGLAASALLGGYHAGIEYGWWEGFTACTSNVTFGAGSDPLAAIMNAPPVRCDEVQWKLAGISLAGLNFLISGAAAIVVLLLSVSAKPACIAEFA